ncbi:MAG: copper oxidase, partial [Planctomycetota bacterium]
MLAAAVASAQSIPSGGRPSPRFGAQPFTQQLLLAEEFGTRPMPPNGQVPAGTIGQINAAASMQGCPTNSCIDPVLSSAPAPTPTRECNPLPQNPNKALIEELLGRPAPYVPADGRPPGAGWAHQRFEEFPPQAYFQSAQTGARTNTGLRNVFQRHGYTSGEFAPGGLYHNTVGAPGFEGTTAGIAP